MNHTFCCTISAQTILKQNKQDINNEFAMIAAASASCLFLEFRRISFKTRNSGDRLTEV